MSSAEHAVVALNNLAHLFLEECPAGLHQVALDCFTTESHFKESDSEGETGSDGERDFQAQHLNRYQQTHL